MLTRAQIESWGPHSAELLKEALGETAPVAAPPLADDCDEVREFMPRVIALAESLGWEVWHCRITAFSKPGFLDLELVRPPRLLKLELKSTKGKLTGPQKRLLNLYRKCPGIEAEVFYPRNWKAIEELLR